MSVSELLSIDTIITRAVDLGVELPRTQEFAIQTQRIRELRERLAGGRLQIAVLGQFNRGKSTFINSLLRIKILPISVLPLTSVPTIISYGHTNQCTISFSDSKNDLTVHGDGDTIAHHLTTYVTEKNNPENRLCVSQAVVKCENHLLEHGTVIIDTPGFGSTYTHNTQTTIDLLSSCDAALFLFSADLPITQIEVEFLKKAFKTVPRIFFIYNKIDLLNKKELQTSRLFIEKTLTKELNLTSGIKLFPVSAKRVALSNNSDTVFHRSGLANVEKEIINFLLREKYFTLSEALTNKFTEALTTIISLLEKKKKHLLEPLKQKKDLLDKTEQLSSSVKKAKEQSLVSATNEGKACVKYSNDLLTQKKDGVQSLTRSRLRELCSTPAGKNSELVISTALTQLLEEIFSRMYMFTLNKINKLLQKLAIGYIRELKNLAGLIDAKLDFSINKNINYVQRIEKMQVEGDKQWKPTIAFVIDPPKKKFFERFLGYTKPNSRLFDHYSLTVYNKIDIGLEELGAHMNSVISLAFESFERDIKKDYFHILDLITKIHSKEQQEYQEQHRMIEPELSHFSHLIEKYKEIIALIK